MNVQTPLPRENSGFETPDNHGPRLSLEDRLDQTLAVCSRLLVGCTQAGQALQSALAHMAFGFDALHVSLFQIESYHSEDNRGRRLACSTPDECPHCLDNREWDYVRLLDNTLRAQLERGKSCTLNVKHLATGFQGDFHSRDVDRLIFVPLTVLGRWWGFLCIEAGSAGLCDHPGDGNHLETIGALFSVYYERQHAVEGFQERNKLSGALEMAGTVCHKLNQPMQVILGYASMVTSGDIRDKEQIIEIVQMIEDETRQMGIITKNLMGITKNHGAD